MNGEKTKRIQRVADILTKCGLLTEVSGNITGMIWDKLLINVATGLYVVLRNYRMEIYTNCLKLEIVLLKLF
ncbi:hypothetical protein AAAC51_39155 [Priestia megaterium]